MPGSWTTRVEEASKNCYVTAELLPGQWECDWQEWPGLLYMLGGKESMVKKFMDRAFGITGRIEALAFIPEAFEYFMFAVNGQYYEFVDFEVTRFDTPFATHDDFLRMRSIQPMDLRRTASTKLEPRPEFDPHQGYHDDDGEPVDEDFEWDSEAYHDDDEDFELDGDEVGIPQCKLATLIALFQTTPDPNFSYVSR
ncbi:hypothetical protein C8J57DRAFT_346028 [Mycena rebaudengoi]|nr:hypothetical protein C8J57DRAFT_346028 [Mycena rebaudengoi]